MLKKTGLILISSGLLVFFAAVYIIKNNSIFGIGEGLLSVSLASIFLGIAFQAINSKKSIQKKYKVLFLTISLALLALCLLSAYYRWPGTNIEGVLAVFFYCFAYSPLELYLKNAKWRVYSNNKWEMFLLSSLDYVGINFILLGILTRILHWPGQYYLIYSGSGLLLAGLFLWNLRFKQEVVRRKTSEDLIKLQVIQIQKEKHVSDNLLLNILPAEVAEELKTKGSADAKQFDEVTVLFTDFKDFTRVTEKMTAKELVDEIHACFMAFDHITDKYGLEKIKTIGDSYMCAGGLPVANKTHATDAVNAGLEMQQYILNRELERIELGKEPFQIRIGIHTGPVVAGIVGIKKFAYDIWGDTVNTASRMESSGQAGKVNISETTYQRVNDKFVFTDRGMLPVKGKGELHMYFVEGRS